MPELHIVLLACFKAIHCDTHLRNKELYKMWAYFLIILKLSYTFKNEET